VNRKKINISPSANKDIFNENNTAEKLIGVARLLIIDKEIDIKENKDSFKWTALAASPEIQYTKERSNGRESRLLIGNRVNLMSATTNLAGETAFLKLFQSKNVYDFFIKCNKVEQFYNVDRKASCCSLFVSLVLFVASA
jgi:hypothetical protein